MIGPGPFKMGRKTRVQLATAHPDLQELMRRVLSIYDISVLEGRRTEARQRANVEKGVSKTMDSRHIPRNQDGSEDPDGLSEAVDASPYPVRWPQRNSPTYMKDAARFYYMQGIIYAIARDMGLPIRQGIDWDRDLDFFDQNFDDMPHVELPRGWQGLQG